MKAQIIVTTLALSFTSLAQPYWSHQKTETPPAGSAPYPWMNEMRKQGIKRAVVWIDIRFHRNGRPKELNLDHIEYLTEYKGGTPISDSSRLAAIRATSLEEELKNVALEKARHGYWVPDLPRPRPHPFIGGAQVEFVDDESHPIPHGATYYAKNSE